MSHAWHLPRALAAFERAGVAATPAPTCFVHREGEREPNYRDWLPSIRAFSTSYYVLHEYLRQAWYSTQGEYGPDAGSHWGDLIRDFARDYSRFGTWSL